MGVGVIVGGDDVVDGLAATPRRRRGRVVRIGVTVGCCLFLLPLLVST